MVRNLAILRHVLTVAVRSCADLLREERAGLHTNLGEFCLGLHTGCVNLRCGGLARLLKLLEAVAVGLFGCAEHLGELHRLLTQALELLERRLLDAGELFVVLLLHHHQLLAHLCRLLGLLLAARAASLLPLRRRLDDGGLERAGDLGKLAGLLALRLDEQPAELLAEHVDEHVRVAGVATRRRRGTRPLAVHGPLQPQLPGGGAVARASQPRSAGHQGRDDADVPAQQGQLHGSLAVGPPAPRRRPLRQQRGDRSLIAPRGGIAQRAAVAARGGRPTRRGGRRL